MQFPGIDYKSEYEESNYDVESILVALDLDLHKNGDWYNGLCPFHSDSNPSFGINIISGLWNCFSCGSGGIESFVAKILNLDTREEIYNWLKPFNKYIEANDIDALAERIRTIELLKSKKENNFDDLNFRFALWVRMCGRTKFEFDIVENMLAMYDKFVNIGDLSKAEELATYMMNNI